jgi:hypothetical protein
VSAITGEVCGSADSEIEGKKAANGQRRGGFIPLTVFDERSRHTIAQKQNTESAEEAQSAQRKVPQGQFLCALCVPAVPTADRVT